MSEEPEPVAATPSTEAPQTPQTPRPQPRRPGRGTRMALIACALVVALVGVGAAGAAYYVRSVDVGDPISLPATTTLYYSDGTVLAHVGDQRRTPLRHDEILPVVAQATVAADDPGFWGGTATAITRGYVRHAYDISSDGASTQARVGVIAWKLENQLPREEILADYLNTVPYGRNAYGIEAAAQAYFGKSARRDAETAAQLTASEAIALAAMPRQPEADPADPQVRPGYDPTRSDQARQNAGRRFAEIRDAMLDLGSLTADQAAALTYPNVRPYDPEAIGADLRRPAGLVVNHVLSELTTAATSPFKGWSWSRIRSGGYRIFTTIDARAQAALERVADPSLSGSALNGQPENLQAAAVLVEPGTGRVLGYYGGQDGSDADYAGIYLDETGEGAGLGAHPPGGTFQVHTLAAALQAGYSLRSRWNSAQHDMTGRTGQHQIRNTARCPTGTDVCTLADSTLVGLETTFYALTVSVSPLKVLEMARDVGIRHLWDDRGDRHQVVGTDPSQLVGAVFNFELGTGQYPATVLDQANAMATYAAGGLAAQAHFVEKVVQGEETVYAETLPTPDQPRVISQTAVDDLTWVLGRTAAGQIPGWDSASKTGVWQYAASLENSDAWIVGYTRALAMAVWVGNQGEVRPIKTADGQNIVGAGLPATIYRDVMVAVHDAMSLENRAFNPPAFAGRIDPPGSVAG